MSSLMTKVLNKLEKKIQSDDTFLEKLKKSPKKVFEETADIKLPDTMQVQLETSSNPLEITIVLPPSPEMLKQFGKSHSKLIEFYKSMYFYAKNQKETKEKLKDAELQQLVASKAWKDKEFMKKLNDSPKEAVQSMLSKKLDPEIKIKVLKNNLNTLHLPIHLLDTSREISEAELKQVAGGGLGEFAGKVGLFLAGPGLKSPMWEDIGKDLDEVKF